MMLLTPWPPLMAMWSSPVLIVLWTSTPHVASAVSPGSMPSVLRAKCGDISSPWLFSQREGVKTVTPHTMKPCPCVVQGAVGPPGGFEVILTWNLGELCSVIRYSKSCVVPLVRLISVGLPMLPSIDCSAPESCHHEYCWFNSGSPPCPSMMPSPTMPGAAPPTVRKFWHAPESLTPTFPQSSWPGIW